MRTRRKARRPPRSKSRPRWNSELRELYIGRTLIKAFGQRAPHQELICTAFEEDNWPRRIDDPLPGDGVTNSKQRLHDAIKNLNKGHRARGIKFRGDGTGQGVIWEPA
jgi:hypothetical protein